MVKILDPFFKKRIGALRNRHHVLPLKRVEEKFFDRRTLSMGLGMIEKDEK